MYAASDSRLGFRHALAGLQAGVLGALVMFICVMAGSLWHGRSIWVVPNLFSTTFFGSDAYRNQLLKTSWVGVAVIVAIYGLLGMLWGCIWRDDRKQWLGLYGAIAGLAVYFLFYDFIWRHVNPIVTLYAPDRQLQVGHVLWGIVLARSPLYARRISESEHPGGSANPQPANSDTANAQDAVDAQDNDAPAVRSGEVMQ